MKKGSGDSRRTVLPAVLVFLSLALAPSPAAAHRPAAVILDYRGGAGTLAVTIEHRVSNPAGHYIASVRIWKNGAPVKEASYTSQPAKEGAAYTYDLPAAEGDVLRVEAVCSVFGSRSEEITVFVPGEAAAQAPGASAVDGVIAPGEYPSRAEFEDGLFSISWRIDGDFITVALAGKTTGWVAIGIEPAESMKDADMIFGWVSGEGKAFSVDAWSTGLYGPHPPDATLGGTNDIAAFAGTETNGVTVFEFTRPLDTGDRYDRKIPSSGAVNVLWAVGPSDRFTERHATRGKGTLAIGK
ncbi:MAG TPA: DOMON domain-containing protein [Syntrophales bacterium]|nr:DOMON domain-containing protein [Syntrophales bacterium]HPX11541.1 DOMON domain-containing protein [Syntrophales bacterium]HQB30593.1 DOMON domain-containing protein [Syntrophales bacterium]HQN79205.1 DOMON domain-containing protein [Syntrophales bacterium]HQQ28393.1 DOMON domain-containing protein [Syntrophales bacterium]